MAVSWELLAWAMPRMLVVCITSTEKLGSQLAMRDPIRQKVDFCVRDKASKWTWSSRRFILGPVPLLPSKWKKWLCWLMCGLASAAAPAGPMFSSSPAPCCWLPTWPPSPLMFRDVRQVGQEVSCSSHDRRHELEKNHKHARPIIVFTWTAACTGLTSLLFIERSGLLLLLRLFIAWWPSAWLTESIKCFVNITAFSFWEVQTPGESSHFHLEVCCCCCFFFTCGKDDHREVYVLSTWNPNRWHNHHH